MLAMLRDQVKNTEDIIKGILQKKNNLLVD